MTTKRKRISLEENQSLFIVTLTAVAGNISKACDIVGVARQTYYNWLDDDESDFADKIASIQFEAYERRIDLAEEKMDDRVRLGSGPDIRFILKTLGAKRGYGAKSTVTLNPGEGFKGMEWPEETEELDDWETTRDKEMPPANATQSQEGPRDPVPDQKEGAEGAGPEAAG